MKSIVASQAKPKEKKTKQIKGVFEKNGGLIYSILAFILLGQNVMAEEVSYPVTIYPPGGTGAVRYNGSDYGLPRAILVLKAKMSGTVAFRVTTDLIKADVQPYNSYCLPASPIAVSFTYAGPESFIQPVGFYFDSTRVTIENTGETTINLKTPDFDVQLAKAETHSFGIAGPWPLRDAGVIRLWRTRQTALFSCTSNWTSNNENPNQTIKAFEIEIKEVEESDTSSAVPDDNSITSENSSTTTSTMPETSGTTFEVLSK